MQIQRLFEIIYMLLYRKRITAKELAQRFEVSTRTIYRDIETLSAAGIPIYTNKGKDGGIFLMENYVLNRSLLNDNEQKEILSALQGLQQLQPDQQTATLSRLRTFFAQEEPDWIEVDLSDWSNRKQSLFQDIRQSICSNNEICFTYYSSYGKKSRRRVYPLQLWFKDHSWYLRGFCVQKQALRIFKISRMSDMSVSKEHFDPTLLPQLDHPSTQPPLKMVDLTLRIQAAMAYRVYDEFEETEITCLENGDFIIHVSYPLDQWVYGNLLSYGASLQVIKPIEIRDTLIQQIKAMVQTYE